MANNTTLPEIWDVPAVFRDRLGIQVGRQRAIESNGHLLLILHELPEPEDVARKGRYFWRAPDGVWSSNSLGGGTKALKKHLEEYFDRVAKIEDKVEQATRAVDYFDVISELTPIHRSVRNMHQAIQQAREQFPQDRDILNFRDRAYRIERTAELLLGDAKTSLDFLIAKRAEEQAESSRRMAEASHRLNVLAAFFFPMATLAALYGVNLRHGWETVQTLSELLSAPGPSFPFLLLILVGLMLGFFLKSFVARKTPMKPE